MSSAEMLVPVYPAVYCVSLVCAVMVFIYVHVCVL